MRKVLPRLIDGALAARDREAAQLRAAAQARAQAQQMQDRLQAFRAECLARSPAAQLGRTDAASLADQQQFLGRLDEALVLQAHEVGRRESAAGQQQARLAQAQQRLLAFETLARRLAQRQDRADARRGQREADEFAARASRADRERSA